MSRLSEDRASYIYVLVDPRTAEIRYVGVTVKVLAYRRSQHISTAKAGDKRHVSNWIRTLLSTGREPVILCVEVTKDRSRENYWIAHYRAAGLDLTNLTDGGDGVLGLIPTPASRQKMSLAQTGRTASNETREKRRQALLGRVFSSETLERMRASAQNRGPETLEKMRQAKLGGKQTAQHVENNRKSNTGKLRSSETKERIRAATLAYYERNGTAIRSRSQGPEERKSRSQSLLLYHQKKREAESAAPTPDDPSKGTLR